MALSKARIVSVGETAYPHERDGIEFIEKALPDTNPYHLWALVDMLDTSTGRLLEIDAVVLGYACLYVLELKAYSGRIEGDALDWLWTTPEGRRNRRDNPRSGVKRKAQVLKGRLDRVMPEGVRCPWVEPLVFLSDPDIDIQALSPEGRFGVVTRPKLLDALVRHTYPGADPNQQSRAITQPQMRATVQALQSIGFRPRKGKRFVGSYEVLGLLEETPTFQEREAVHRTIPSQRRRARTYLVPEQTSVERRQQLLRAAEREAQLLHEVREHPNILTLTDYVPDAPLGPTVLLDDFERGVPLDAFLRLEPDLGFSDRIAILTQVAGALGHCHRRQIIHGGVCPAAVLVRRGDPTSAEPAGPIETRLYNFQLGGSHSVEATSHWSALGTDSWAVYQAPELRRDPTQRTVEADVFSLGAIGYLLLTGQPPGNTVAEVEARMRARRCLDPRDASDAIPDQLAEAIAMATAEVLAQRANDTGEWIDLVLDSATAPAPASEPVRSPLDARKDDRLGDLQVLRVLGHGASARVLEVERDDLRYALKVSLGAEHDDRIAAEGRVLARLRHPRIVKLEGTPVIAGRPCLLMSVAGTSLHRELAEHGTPSLDYAIRWGTDLLGALGHLEDEDVLHRDIKPANMGVGMVGKRAQSLMLFDFSLAGVPVTDVGVGTAAYRDPQLAARGRWDAAADRYSAAVTLHELLTGQRPALEPGGTAVLAAERFDSAVRPGLVEFFTAALASSLAARHASAEAMQRAWERAFEAPRVASATSDAADDDEAEAPPITDEALAALAPTTPIQALPLTARAKNALDRAGILCVGELRDLPPNRLSVIRGVGRQVAKEILELRDRWSELAAAVPAAPEPGFFPGFGGADLIVTVAVPALSAPAAAALGDAGLRSLGALATAPRTQVIALARRGGIDPAVLTAALARAHAAAQATAQPTTLAAWVELLLGGKTQHHRAARALFGLDATPYADVREVAVALGKQPPAIYSALGNARTAWKKLAALPDLVAEVRGVLDAATGATPLAAAGEELLTRLPHADEPAARAHAIALVRVVVECDKDEPDGVRFVRLASDAPWLVRRAELVAPLERLGEVADELAARDILAGPAEAHRALAELAAGTPLAELPADRLVRLAAAASRAAAVSSRLELYPRGMDPRRALELAAALVPGQITDGKLRELVTARYPDAAPLPPRPTLDELVAGLGLHYDHAAAAYARPGVDARTTRHTGGSSYTRLATQPPRGADIDPRLVEIQAFDDQLRLCLERRALLVIGVSAERAADAERALARRLGLTPRSFDALFVAELARQMQTMRVEEQVVYATDAAGPGAPAWGNLARLAGRTAAAIAAGLLPPRAPLLLTQPGLIDRYQLVELLRALVEASRTDDADAILLLVPGIEGGIPTIGRTPIPDLLPGQTTWIPKAWIGAQLQLPAPASSTTPTTRPTAG